MTARPNHRRPGALFLSLALVLMLHPVSGASQASGEGLGGLLKALLCACSFCQADEPLEEGCCSEEPPPAEDDCEGGCPCTHELELPEHQPLSSPPLGEDAPGAAFVLAHARVSATTVDVVALVAERPAAPPGPPGALRSWSGSAPFRLLAAGPIGLLAALSTARI